MARVEGNQDVTLRIDEDSGLLGEAKHIENGDTEQFFDGNGNPSPAIKGIWKFFQEVEAHRSQTELAVGALAEALPMLNLIHANDGRL